MCFSSNIITHYKCSKQNKIVYEFIVEAILFGPGEVQPSDGQVVIHVDGVRQDAALLRAQEAAQPRPHVPPPLLQEVVDHDHHHHHPHLQEVVGSRDGDSRVQEISQRPQLNIPRQK